MSTIIKKKASTLIILAIYNPVIIVRGPFIISHAVTPRYPPDGAPFWQLARS